MSVECTWLHTQLECLPLVRFPFVTAQLPMNGIYFFYEDAEKCGHGGNKPKIVRVGTHKDGNFRSRISEHFLLNQSGELHISPNRAAPKDRSIFRKNIGRALLNRDGDPYLSIWNVDYTNRTNRDAYGHLRDTGKEEHVEAEITRQLRQRFSFRFVILENQAERMGSSGLESRLIGTVAQCNACGPSETWLGLSSPDERIVGSGLWQVQHLASPIINATDEQAILKAIKETMRWLDGEHDQ